MTFTDQRKLTIIARAKLRRLTLSDNCGDDGCPGWAVFETSDGLEIEACIDCWHGVADPLTDDEAAAMPEARALLIDEHRRTGIPLSVWQRSLGFPDLPKLTAEEERQLKRELEAGRRYMEKRGEA